MKAVTKTRDLEKDLAICGAATPGPWITDENPRCQLVWGPNNSGHGAIAEVRKYQEKWSDNLRFIAEAREGWPYAIRRALEAEAEIDRLRNEIAILREQLEQRCYRA